MTEKEAAREVHKAELRGRRFSSALADYERAAMAGPIRIKEALVSRHNQRMENIAALPDAVRAIALSAIVPAGPIDLMLIKFGVTSNRHPASYYGSAVDHLAWGVDSVVAAARLLLSGQFAGASALARHQLERWTNLRAFNLGATKGVGESAADYIARVWSSDMIDHHGVLKHPSTADLEDLPDLIESDEVIISPEEPESRHEHVFLSDGSEICPAALFGVLSNVLHAVEGIDSLKWDAVSKCDPDAMPAEVPALAMVIADAISLSLRVIRSALGTMANQRKDTLTARHLRTMLDRFSDPEEVASSETQNSSDASRYLARYRRIAPMPEYVTSPGLWALVPLHPAQGLSSELVEIVEKHASVFDDVIARKRPAGRLFRDDEFASFNFAWHRRASVRFALRAMDLERKFHGDDFNIETLTWREMPYIFASEMAGLLSGWLKRAEPAAAAALVASGLRSSYWLWLEDDDRAMALLRAVLEQTCRIRAWRKNPQKAERLEESPKTTPRDWLNVAGWRRLEVLNRALGEMAHSRSKPKWDGARELLAKLQIGVDDETSIYTARGHCLDLVVSLLCREIVETVKTMSAQVGEAFSKLLEMHGVLGGEADADVEAKLNHAWALRATPLENPEYAVTIEGDREP